MKRSGVDVEAALTGGVVILQCSRSPMAAGAFTRLVIIVERDGKYYLNDRRIFWSMSYMQIAVSAMDIYLDGGDLDGDDAYFTLCRHLNLTHVSSFNMVRSMRRATMGFDMFSVEALQAGLYAADHYQIKSWKSASATLASGLKDSITRKALVTKENYLEFSKDAYSIQKECVGSGYDLFLIGDLLANIAISASKIGFDVPGRIRDFGTQAGALLNLVTAEIYESLLGGYSKEMAAFCKNFIKPVAKDGSAYITPATIDEFKAGLRSIGVNPEYALLIAKVFNLVSDLKRYQVKRSFAKYPDADLAVVLSLCLVAYELGRGRFAGFSGKLRSAANTSRSVFHRHCLAVAVEYLSTYDNEFENSCLTLVGMKAVFADLGFELQGHSVDWTEEQLAYFSHNVAQIGSTMLTVHAEEVQEIVALPPVEDEEGGGSGVALAPAPVKGGDDGGASAGYDDSYDYHEQEYSNDDYDDYQGGMTNSYVEVQQPVNLGGLTASQGRAKTAYKSGNHLEITGKAGTGKSYLIDDIKTEHENNGGVVILCGSKLVLL
jgi:hypothetical protein